jgi:hypothetical protein
LARGQLQLELLAQELADLVLDLLGLLPGAGEAEHPVIGVAAVPQPPVARIGGVAGGHGLHLPAQPPARLPFSALFQAPGLLP